MAVQALRGQLGIMNLRQNGVAKVARLLNTNKREPMVIRMTIETQSVHLVGRIIVLFVAEPACLADGTNIPVMRFMAPGTELVALRNIVP